MSTAIENAISWALYRCNNPDYYYVLPPNPPYGWDCSSFVIAAYGQGAGVNTHGASDTSNMVSCLTTDNTFIDLPFDLNNARRGDIFMWDGSGTAGHACIYLGNNEICHAANSTTGIVGPVPYYPNNYTDILRLNELTPSLQYWDAIYSQRLWNYINSYTHNDYGTAGLMGNLYAESSHDPYRCEGDNVYPYTDSYNATMNTIRGLTNDQFCQYKIYSSLTNQQNGYSLAQWTWIVGESLSNNRKQRYYSYCGQSLLGDPDKSMQFLIWELQNYYPAVWNVLCNASSIDEASDYVLRYYEVPADIPSKIPIRRNYSLLCYNDFSGGGPIPPGPTGRRKGLPIWLINKIVRKEF